jgi:AcrR family transcriptional regulator
MQAQRPPLPKRERTRRRLIEAAFELVQEKGFADVTMDDVAARVGLTKGAIYGNFEDKEDLLVATVLANTRAADVVEFGKSLREYLGNLGRAVAAVSAPGAGTPSFHAYVVSNPAMVERLTRHYAARYALSEAELKAAFPEDRLPLPNGQFAALIHAVSMGIMYQRLISRGLLSNEAIVAAFEALALIELPAE